MTAFELGCTKAKIELERKCVGAQHACIYIVLSGNLTVHGVVQNLILGRYKFSDMIEN